MPWVARALGLSIASLAVACSDPRLEVALAWPSPAPPLVDAVDSYVVTVASLADRDCDDLIWGQVSEAELELGTLTTAAAVRTSAGVLPGATLDAVPRLGEKLVVFTGYDDRGVVVAGGCQELGDFTDDHLVTIDVESATVTRVVPAPDQRESLLVAPTTRVGLAARERRVDGSPVDAAQIRSYVRVAGAPEARCGTVAATPPTLDEFEVTGLTTGTPCADAVPGGELAGPVDLVVRGRWSDAVNHVAMYAPVRQVAVWPPSGMPHPPSVIDPSLTLGVGADGTAVIAMLRQLAGQEPEFLVFAVNQDPPAPVTITGPGPIPRTLEAYFRPCGAPPCPRLIVGSVPGRWVWLDQTQAPPQPRATAGPATAADQLVAFRPCGAAPSIGLVAAAAGAFAGYADLTPTAAAASAPVAQIAAALASDAAGAAITLLGTGCIRADVAVPVLAARQGDGAGARFKLYAWVQDHVVAVDTPFVGAVTAATSDDGAGIVAGAVVTATGVRVQSFRLRLAPSPELIPDGLVDHPVPYPPGAVAALLANTDDALDTVSLLDADGVLGLGMTMGGAEEGEAISAMLRTDLPPTFLRVQAMPKQARHQLLLLSSGSGWKIIDISQAPLR